MSDGIVERLILCEEAASEIERLKKQNSSMFDISMELQKNWLRQELKLLEKIDDSRIEIRRLRDALDKIANGPRCADNSYLDLFVELKLEARAALAGEKTDD